jgi:hypothetical protein
LKPQRNRNHALLSIGESKTRFQVSRHLETAPSSKVLVGDVSKRLNALLREKAAEIDLTIMHLAISLATRIALIE